MAWKFENGKWTQVPESANTTNKPSSNSGGSGSSGSNPRPPTTSNIPTPPPLVDAGSGSNSGSGGDGTSGGGSGSAEKQYKDVDFNKIDGDAEVFPNTQRKAKTFINVQGVGKQLSGKYFVEEVTHTFSSNGYTQKLKLSRDKFAYEKLKKR